MATYGYTYDKSGSVQSIRDVTTVELISENHEVAQLTLLPEGDGFLIRVWGADQLHEYGGGNLNTFSAVLKFEGSEALLESLSHNKNWGARQKEED